VPEPRLGRLEVDPFEHERGRVRTAEIVERESVELPVPLRRTCRGLHIGARPAAPSGEGKHSPGGGCG
jgi:hypothetical protein